MNATAPKRADEPEPGRCGRPASLHRAQEHPQGRALEGGVALQEVAPPFRHRHHPLPHWQAWEVQMVGRLNRQSSHHLLSGRRDGPPLLSNNSADKHHAASR